MIVGKWCYIVGKDIASSFRLTGHLLPILAFAFIISALFVFGIGSNPELLQSIAPGIIWSIILLASLLSIHAILKEDANDGTLLTIYTEGFSPVLLYIFKVASHWFSYMLPLLFFLPLIATMFAMPQEAYSYLIASLVLGSIAMSLLSTIAATLTAQTRASYGVASVIILPLYIPIIIFGSHATLYQQPNSLAILGGLICILLPLCVCTGAWAIKFLLENK